MDEVSIKAFMPTENEMRYLPEGSRESLAAYIEHGRPVGSFLTAVLCNDFMAAASRADIVNKHRLFDYIYFLYNFAPAGCHSSESNYKEWLRVGGLRGREASPPANAGADAPLGLRDDPLRPGDTGALRVVPSIDTGD